MFTSRFFCIMTKSFRAHTPVGVSQHLQVGYPEIHGLARPTGWLILHASYSRPGPIFCRLIFWSHVFSLKVCIFKETEKWLTRNKPERDKFIQVISGLYPGFESKSSSEQFRSIMNLHFNLKSNEISEKIVSITISFVMKTYKAFLSGLWNSWKI